MEFRDLKKQYEYNKVNIDNAIHDVLHDAHFIQGREVKTLEKMLADYVGVKHCVTCANGTDALQLALMTWNIGENDVVFVPDFTFFSSGEVVALQGAKPIFVDVDWNTFNIDPDKLEIAIKNVLNEGKYNPKVVIAVDLFGQPADYKKIRKIAGEYGLYVLEDAAQGFGGAIEEEKNCSFGDISITSFFPAKPLGCYGDGGALFTNNDEWAKLINSYAVHGKGESKYDNVRIGMNSRLDTIQAAVLMAKLPIFVEEELDACGRIASFYNDNLCECVEIPYVMEGFKSSWAQYTIKLDNEEMQCGLQQYLKANGIPTMIYYKKPMHRQSAFAVYEYNNSHFNVTNKLCKSVLSLPMHPYMRQDDLEKVVENIRKYMVNNENR